jgi:iron complex transport system substrate-binding protein
MKQMKSLLWLATVVFLASCFSAENTEAGKLPAVVEVVKPHYAKGFDWKKLADSSYQITLFNLESPGDTLQVIRWKPRDIERIACLSTTHIPFLSALDCLHKVKGAGFADRLMDTTAKRLYESNDLINLTTGNELEPEAVFSIAPDILFVYPFGGKSYEKFLSQGIGCVQVSEYLEKHPLGRAEWIRLFGCLLGKQALADRMFNEIESQYVILRDSIAKGIANRPVVFAGSMDGDRWAVPSANSYLATLLYDAGARYVFSDTSATGNLVLPFESFYASATAADYWGKIIYDEQAASAASILQGDDRLRELPAFKNRRVFVCNAMQTDYHGQALLEPHHLLLDMHRIFENSELSVNNRYFKPWAYYE